MIIPQQSTNGAIVKRVEEKPFILVYFINVPHHTKKN